jgi:transposase
MESTGVFWKPISNLVESLFELLLVNAQHLKAVPGRQTDVRDAEWIADLLRHGLLQPSCVPPSPPRDLRDLTRTRTTLVAERARIVNRIQQVLEDANLKRAAVATDSTGLSARAMLGRCLRHCLPGKRIPSRWRHWPGGSCAPSTSNWPKPSPATCVLTMPFCQSEPLAHLDFLDEAIVHFRQEIVARMKVEAEASALLDTIPGVRQRAAEILLRSC